jgi:integrase
MSRALTAIAVEKLKARPKRYEVADPGQRGLKLVVFPSGAKSFVVRYRFGGVKRKLTLGHVSLAAARKAAAAALYDVHEGRDPAAAKKVLKAKARRAATDTVQAICEGYFAREGDKKLRTSGDRKKALERLVYPTLGSRHVESVMRSEIVQLLDRVEDQSGPVMADRALAYLRRVFSWHAGRSDTFRSPIVRGMARTRPSERARSRVLADEEIKKIWTATEPRGDGANPFHALVRFLLLTGARRNEARFLQWSEIDGTSWRLPAARNKTKVELVRPLSKAAQAVLAALPRFVDGPFVFTGTGRHALSMGKPKAAFDAACGVEGWTLHDMRRTARTLLSRAGVDADTGERCLGHVLPPIRRVYDQHQYQPEMLAAFEALAAQIGRVVNPAKNVVQLKRGRKAAK